MFGICKPTKDPRLAVTVVQTINGNGAFQPQFTIRNSKNYSWMILVWPYDARRAYSADFGKNYVKGSKAMPSIMNGSFVDKFGDRISTYSYLDRSAFGRKAEEWEWSGKFPPGEYEASAYAKENGTKGLLGFFQNLLDTETIADGSIGNVVRFTIPKPVVTPTKPVVTPTKPVVTPTKPKIQIPIKSITSGPDWIKVVVADSVSRGLDFGLWVNNKWYKLQKQWGSREFTFTGLLPDKAYRGAVNRPNSEYDVTWFDIRTAKSPVVTPTKPVVKFLVTSATSDSITIRIVDSGNTYPYKVAIRKVVNNKETGTWSLPQPSNLSYYKFTGLSPNTQYKIAVARDGYQTTTLLKYTEKSDVVTPTKPVEVSCSDPKRPQRTNALDGQKVCCPSGSDYAYFKNKNPICITCAPQQKFDAKAPGDFKCADRCSSGQTWANNRCVAKTSPVKPGQKCTPGSTQYGTWCCSDTYKTPNTLCRSLLDNSLRARSLVAGASYACSPQMPQVTSLANGGVQGNLVCCPQGSPGAVASNGKYRCTAPTTTVPVATFNFSSVTSSSVTIAVTEKIQHTIKISGANGVVNESRQVTGPGSATFNIIPNSKYTATVSATGRRTAQKPFATGGCPAGKFFYNSTCNDCPPDRPHVYADGSCNAKPRATATCPAGKVLINMTHCCPPGKTCSDICTLLSGTGTNTRGAVDGSNCECVPGYERSGTYCCAANDRSASGKCVSIENTSLPSSTREKVGAPFDPLSLCNDIRNKWMCSVVDNY